MKRAIVTDYSGKIRVNEKVSFQSHKTKKTIYGTTNSQGKFKILLSYYKPGMASGRNGHGKRYGIVSTEFVFYRFSVLFCDCCGLR